MSTTIPAAITLTSFNCPHCKVLAHQFWWKARAESMDRSMPQPWTKARVDRRIADLEKKSSQKVDLTSMRETMYLWVEGAISIGQADSTYDFYVENVWFSKCHACEGVSVWVHDNLIYPASYDAPAANAEMPGDVLSDYKEAASIAHLSAHGAAALLRLAVQKLMPHLGQKGNNLNDDIAALVARGLDSRIQQSLDVVRVIGNNAVHPGQIDLKDNRQTVTTLFNLVNLIVDAMIAQPKLIEATFQSLPQGARDQIARRDKPKA